MYKNGHVVFANNWKFTYSINTVNRVLFVSMTKLFLIAIFPDFLSKFDRPFDLHLAFARKQCTHWNLSKNIWSDTLFFESGQIQHKITSICNKYCMANMQKIKEKGNSLKKAFIEFYRGSALHTYFSPRPHCVSSVLITRKDKSFEVKGPVPKICLYF